MLNNITPTPQKISTSVFEKVRIQASEIIITKKIFNGFFAGKDENAFNENIRQIPSIVTSIVGVKAVPFSL
ncbi:MAG: hypothetical protein QM725_11475 [Lacibacter sp.]